VEFTGDVRDGLYFVFLSKFKASWDSLQLTVTMTDISSVMRKQTRVIEDIVSSSLTPVMYSYSFSAAPATSVLGSEGFSGSEDFDVLSDLSKPAVLELTPSSIGGCSPSSMLREVCSVVRAVDGFQNGARADICDVDRKNWLTDETAIKPQQSNISRNVSK
jgi:hypothetical protein